MAVTAVATVALEVSYITEKSDDGGGNMVTRDQYNTRLDSREQFANGTATAEINRVYRDRRVITAASGTDDLNLSALTDPIFGTTINFDKVKFLYIKNQEPVDSDGANLLIRAAPSAGWHNLFNGQVVSGNVIKLGPQDEFCITRKETGIDCPTANSTLRILHDGGSTGAMEYDIIIGGTV